MIIYKYAVRACIFLLAAAGTGAGSILSTSTQSLPNPVVKTAGFPPPTVDMRQFQRVFN